MAAELRLGVSFDLVYFRQQLQQLSRIAASEFTAPIKIKLHRQTVDRELSELQRLFARREYKININDAAVAAASLRIDTLQSKITALRNDVKNAIVIKVKYQEEGGGFAAGKTGAAGLYEYMRKQGLSGGNMPGAAQAGRRTQFEAAVERANNAELRSMLQRGNVSGRSGLRTSAAMRERLLQLDDVAMESILGNLEMRMREPRKVSNTFLDKVARAVFWMAGVDPEYLKQQAAQRRALPTIDFPSSVPPGPPIGPSSTGRALPPGIIPGSLPGSAFGRQRFLPPQIGQDLNRILREAAFAFVDSLNARIRKVNVREIGRQALPPSVIRGLLPAGVGREPSIYGGTQDRVSSFQRRIEEAYARSAARAAAILSTEPTGRALGAGGSGAAGPYRPFAQPSKGGAIVPFQAPPAQASQLPPGYFQAGKLAAGIRGLGTDFNQTRLPLAGAVSELGGEFATAAKQVLLFGTAYKALAFFTSLPGQAFDAAKGIQTINNQLEAVTGSVANADRSFAFIDDLATRFNVPLQSARDGFVKLYASMAPAGFSAGEIEGLFEGISKATATFGLSADKVDRVNYAFAQMASKGQIMSEELKGQLGDVLPGSLALFARAAQMSIPEFSQAMEDGAFKGEAMAQVLRNVAKIMNSDFGGAASNAANTLQGAMNGLQNSVQRMYEAFEPLVDLIAASAFPYLQVVVEEATRAITAFSAAMAGNQGPANMLDGNARALYDTMQSVREILTAVGTIAQKLAPTFALLGRAVLTLAEAFARVVNNPIGSFLADLTIKIGLGMIAAQAFAKVMGFQLVAALISAARSAVTFRGSLAAMVVALKTSEVAAKAFRLALTGLIVGGLLMGLEMLAAHIGKVANRLADARKKALDATEAIRNMSDTQLVSEKRQRQSNIFLLQKVQKAGGKVSSAAEARQLEEMGLPVTTKGTRGRGVGAFDRSTPSYLLEGVLQREQGLLSEAEYAYKNRNFTPPTPDLEKVDLAAGDGKTEKEKKERESQIPELQERLRLTKELLDVDQRIMEARLSGNDLTVNRIEYEREMLEIASKVRMVKLEDIPDAEKALKIEALRIESQLAFEKMQANVRKIVIEDLRKQSDALEDIRKESTQDLQNTQRYEELLRSGINPALAKATIEVENKFAKVKEEFDLKTKQLQLEVAQLEAMEKRTAEQDKYLTLLKQQLGLRAGAATGIPEQQAEEQGRQSLLLQPKSNAVIALEAFDEAKTKLAELTNPVNALISAAQGIGDAFAQSFSDIVTGASSVQEGLGNLFKNIGKMFIDMAVKMIAQWMVMKAIGLVASIFGGGSAPSGAPSQGLQWNPQTMDFTPVASANGNVLLGGFQAFANGGTVTGPTLGLIGEGRFNEAVVPLPDGRSIPVDLGQGAGNNIATNITVNVSNGQAQSSMSGRGGSALGRELDAAVKDVILRETRPGGIIYSAR